MKRKKIKIVYRGGNHFTVCTCEVGFGEHYDVLEELIGDGKYVTVKWVKEKVKEGKVLPPITGRWHCGLCRPDGDKDCQCSWCKTKK